MTSEKRRRSLFDLIDEYMRRMEEEIEERFEALHHLFFERPSWNAKARTIEPLCNVFVAPDEVVVTADLPYAKEDTVKVKLLGDNVLEISAEMKRKICLEDFGITHHEGEFSWFHCRVNIPVPVSAEAKRVSFKNGILEVRLPRKRGYEIKIE